MSLDMGLEDIQDIFLPPRTVFYVDWDTNDGHEDRCDNDQEQPLV